VRAIVGFLLVTAIVSGGIALMATAPWMRVSHDCSIFCVIARDLEGFF